MTDSLKPEFEKGLCATPPDLSLQCVSTELSGDLQRTLLQASLATSTERISVIDKDFRIVASSPIVAATWKIGMDELIGKLVPDLWGESAFETYVKDAYEKAFSGEHVTESVYFDSNDSHASKGQRTLDFTITPLLTKTGDIDYIVVRVIDQSDREERRDELNYTRQRLADFVDASADWHWEMDSDLRYTWVSKRVTEIFGLDTDHFIGQKRSVLINDTTDKELLKSHFATLDAHKPFRNFDFQHELGGSEYWFRISGVPIFGRDGVFQGYRGTGTDISEIKRIEAETQLEKDRFLRAIDHFPGGFVLLDKKRKIVKYNNFFKEMFCIDNIKIEIGTPYQAFLESYTASRNKISSYDLEQSWIEQRMNQASGEAASQEFIFDGKFFRVNVDDLPDGGQLRTLTDITDLRKREIALIEQEKRFKDIAETAADWFWEIDENGYFTYLSERVSALNGMDSENLLSQKCEDTLIPLISDELERSRVKLAFSNRQQFSGICLKIPGDKIKGYDKKYFIFSGKPNIDSNGEFKGFRGTGQDITQSRLLEDKLLYQANHDSLTGLPNRRVFSEKLSDIAVRTQNTDDQFVLAYIDLDQFKIVNDTAGHQAGDHLLLQVSRLLSDYVNEEECLARLGGDEFGLLFKRDSIDTAEQVSYQIIEALTEFRFNWESQIFTVSASIGLVPIEPGISSVVDLMSFADLACYKSKEEGRAQVHIYTHADDELDKRRSELHMVAGINKAIEEDRFELYAQPIVKLAAAGYELSHYEILLRMRTIEGDLVPPGAFIPAAERFGLMGTLDRWVLSTTLRKIPEILGNHPEIKVSINLSGQSLAAEGLLGYVEEQLNYTGVEPDRVCFELTETAAISNLTLADKFIVAMKSIGCRFALDDFGSGLSSFAYIKHFPVDYLKIDGHFVRDLLKDPTDRVMVTAINQMGQLLNMETIAEFVEDHDTATELRKIGVNYGQGYGLGRPEPFKPGIVEAFEASQKKPFAA